MTKFTYFLAAAVAVTGLSALPMPMRGADISGTAIVPPGDMTKTDAMHDRVDDSTAKDVHAMLARLIDDGYKKGGFDDVVAYLTKADRDRLGKVSDIKVEDLDSQIDGFRKDFHAKYNQDFNVKREHLSDVNIWKGSDKNHVIVTFGSLEGGKRTDMKTDLMKSDLKAGDLGAAAKDMTKTDMTKEGMARGGNSLNLVNEGTVMNAWRVQLPEAITLQQLHDSLLKHITMVHADKANWPSDVGDAYKACSYHLLESLKPSAIAIEK